eukprot:TRINITY_DN76645_c0_g1_i1.p1 TRINITY_DN76645_c0_g1~~TRINITY_DN76645_c0_g1_i1.p1  ORF type:complete len:380 (+),score=53.80 TRINITY_DN76645_c0_g1_i1:25-1164(+)
MARGHSSGVVQDLVNECFEFDTSDWRCSPGVAVMVIKNRVPIIMQGFGQSCTSDKSPLTAQSVFDLASVTKHFTACAVVLCRDMGLLKLDDAACSHLPDLPPACSKITINHLLAHQSGIPEYFELSPEWEEPHCNWYNTEAVYRLCAKAIEDDGLEFEPGTKHEYINSNYALLALIVAKVSGKPFHEFLQQYFFTPLGMTNTWVIPPEPWDDDSKAPRHTRPNVVRGYKETDEGDFVIDEDDVVIAGDGGVFSCLSDLLLWDNAMRDGFVELGMKPGSVDSMFEAYGNTLKTDATDKKDDTKEKKRKKKKKKGYEQFYGKGWEINPDDHSVEHLGSWNGTSTLYYRRLDEEYTIILLANIDDVAHLLDDLAQCIVEEGV